MFGIAIATSPDIKSDDVIVTASIPDVKSDSPDSKSEDLIVTDSGPDSMSNDPIWSFSKIIFPNEKSYFRNK